MTTHRFIQMHNLLDTLTSKVRQCRNAAENLARIGNKIGSDHYTHRADRYARVAGLCEKRLEM